MKLLKVLILVLSFATLQVALAQGTFALPGTITTIAGTGAAGFAGVGGSAIGAELNEPLAFAFDPHGNIYFSDFANNTVFEITSSGLLGLVAGTGVRGYSGEGGQAVDAELNHPQGLAFDIIGNLYITDGGGSRIRKVSPSGVITTVAGNGVPGYSGDGGSAINSELNFPGGVAVDALGNLYIADWGNNRIRKVAADGTISTIAGTGVPGFSGDGGPAINAELFNPQSISIDSSGNLFVADSGNNAIREVTTAGTIFAVAGIGSLGYSGDGGPATSAQLNSPLGVSVDKAENLFIADTGNNVIREVTASGIILTIAGDGAAGYSGDGGSALNAELNSPAHAVVDLAGELYIADSLNHRVREVTYSTQSAVPAMLSYVEGLYGQGVLNAGRANSLSKHLGQAANLAAAGKNSSAIDNLSLFISEVTGLANAGVLTQPEAGALIAAAQTLIATLSA
jgi:sugar lactone lactonase YvrE